MALNFPNSPVLNQEYTVNGVRYIFDGVSWNADHLHFSSWVNVEKFEVRWFDYDGTLLKRQVVYKGTDATHPDPPDRSDKGLTFVEWNWDVTNVQHDIDVAAIHIPTDGKAKLFVDVASTSEICKVALHKTDTSEVSVDWGDGSPVEISSSDVNPVVFTHVYSIINSYIIKVWISSGTGQALWDGVTSSLNAWGYDNDNVKPYLTEVHDTNNVYPYYSAFYNPFATSNFLNLKRYVFSLFTGLHLFDHCGIEYAAIPKTYPSIERYHFVYCTYLTGISIPEEVNFVGSYETFYGCTFDKIIISTDKLKSKVFKTCTIIKLVLYTKQGESNHYGLSDTFEYSKGFGSIILPEEISLISSNAFINVYGLYMIDLVSSVLSNIYAYALASYTLKIIIIRRTSGVVVLQSTLAFAYTPDCLKIYVPDALVNSYKIETNWITYSDKIVALSTLNI